jgi:hypothetical protein
VPERSPAVVKVVSDIAVLSTVPAELIRASPLCPATGETATVPTLTHSVEITAGWRIRRPTIYRVPLAIVEEFSEPHAGSPDQAMVAWSDGRYSATTAGV